MPCNGITVVALHTALHPTSPARHIPRHGIPPLNAMAGRCERLPTAGCAARDFEHYQQVRFATLRTAEPYCGSCGRVPPQMWAQSRRICGRSPGADVGPGPGADVGAVPAQMWARWRAGVASSRDDSFVSSAIGCGVGCSGYCPVLALGLGTHGSPTELRRCRRCVFPPALLWVP